MSDSKVRTARPPPLVHLRLLIPCQCRSPSVTPLPPFPLTRFFRSWAGVPHDELAHRSGQARLVGHGGQRLVGALLAREYNEPAP